MCPDVGHLEPNETVDLVHGKLSPTQRAELERHLADCAGCQGLVLEVLRSSTASPTLPAEPPPVRVGRFLVLSVVGSGAMGTVFSAYDPQLDRRVAIKLIDAATGRARLLQEARALAKVTHPNVVTLHEVGEADEQLYLVMDFVDGQTVRRWLEARRPASEVLDVFRQAAAGLARAHREGIVHRDFKPENVLIDTDGRVRVADFGLAHGVAESGGGLTGTLAYMAPELLEGGAATPASDQFAFAVALVEALTGGRPFVGQSLDDLKQAHRRPPRLSPAVPRRLRATLERALAPQPSGRLPSMEALGAALVAPRAVRAVGLVGAALATLGLGLVALKTPRPSCDGAADAVTRSWNPSAQAELRAKLGEGDDGADTAERTGRLFEAWVGRWREMAVEACESSRRGAQSDAVFTLRRRCLDHRLRDFEALREAILRDARRFGPRAGTAAGALPDVGGCADIDALTATAPLPPGVAEDALAETTAQVADLRARLLLGDYEAGLAAAPGVVARARALGWAPLLAESLQLSGNLESRSGALAKAERTLELALAEADRSADDARRAHVLLDLAHLRGNAGGQLDAWQRTLSSAAAVIERLGGPRRLEWARLRNNEAAMLDVDDRPVEALAAANEALAHFRDAGVPDTDPMVLSALNNHAVILLRLGRVEEAQANFDAWVRHTEAVAGPGSVTLVEGLSNGGIAGLIRGDYDAAGARTERAWRLARKAHGDAHATTARTANNYAQALMALGRLDEALELARLAVRGREQAGPHPALKTYLSTLAAVHLERSELDAASEVFTTLGPVTKAWTDRVQRAAFALAQGRPAHAVDLLEPLDPGDEVVASLERVQACVTKSNALVALNRAPEAARLFGATPCLVSASVDRAELELAEGRVRLALGEPDRARSLATSAAEAFVKAGRARKALDARAFAALASRAPTR